MAVVVRRGQGTAVEDLREDGEEERRRLARASLSTGHEVASTDDDGDAVLLDGGGVVVAGKLDVGLEEVVQAAVGKLVDRRGHVVAGGLDGDVVVVLEVDARGHAREELLLDALVAREPLKLGASDRDTVGVDGEATTWMT